VIRHFMGVRKRSYWGGAAIWWTFIVLPLAVGLLLEQLFDAIDSGGPALLLLAAVTGIELTRAAALPAMGWVFMPFFVAGQTVLRTNVLRAQLHSDPDERGPAIDDASAALPLFREDAQHVVRATDLWLDLVPDAVIGIVALAVIARIDPFVSLAVALPLLAAAALGHLLAPIVRRRRAEDRAVTAEVTSFLGEAFGAITTLSTSGAAPAVLDRVARLCDRRRVTAVRDRVAEQLLPSVGAPRPTSPSPAACSSRRWWSATSSPRARSRSSPPTRSSSPGCRVTGRSGWQPVVTPTWPSRGCAAWSAPATSTPHRAGRPHRSRPGAGPALPAAAGAQRTSARAARGGRRGTGRHA
jgi:ABC-type multidrug transport system fused ATPase/permease subunit